MKNDSLERTMREIAALSAPCTSPAEMHSRLMQINGMARQWLRLAEAAKTRPSFADIWLDARNKWDNPPAIGEDDHG